MVSAAVHPAKRIRMSSSGSVHQAGKPALASTASFTATGWTLAASSDQEQQQQGLTTQGSMRICSFSTKKGASCTKNTHTN